MEKFLEEAKNASRVLSTLSGAQKNKLLNDDELGLITLLQIIWEGKIKLFLIVIISFLVGLGYNFQIPINYLNSLKINATDNSKLIELNHIQKMLNLQGSSQSIMNKFINELKDYDEFLFIIKNKKIIHEDILKLTNEDQDIELFKYAKMLNIVYTKNNNDFILNFNWHDPNQAKRILQDTLDLVSKNLKKLIILELFQALNFQKKLTMNNDKERLVYLIEQSSIAKELDITDNQIDNLNLSQSSVSLSINTADIAYYLRGYKAIDKEIELIKNRKYNNFKYIEEAINNLKDKEIEFVKYNVYLTDSESLKNSKLILVISILLGLILGVIYLLILNEIKSKTA